MERIVQILSQMLRIESEKGSLEPASPLRKELISNLLRVSSFEGLSKAQLTQIVKVCKDYLEHALEFRKLMLNPRRIQLPGKLALFHQRVQGCSFTSASSTIFHYDQYGGRLFNGYKQ
jgi:ABC-type phosphate transport system auxiliary subunit